MLAQAASAFPQNTPHPTLPSQSGGREIHKNDDLLMIVRRVEALGRFVSTDEGKNLLAGTKRAVNILKAEERKDGKHYTDAVDAALLETAGAPEEKALNAALDSAMIEAQAYLAQENFEQAMMVLAQVRPQIDAFFEKILVNDPNSAIRANRLAILAKIRLATSLIADFDRITG